MAAGRSHARTTQQTGLRRSRWRPASSIPLPCSVVRGLGSLLLPLFDPFRGPSGCRRRLIVVVNWWLWASGWTFHLMPHLYVEEHRHYHNHRRTGSEDEKPPEHPHSKLG